MTIKQLLELARRRARFGWHWTSRKPGILFLHCDAYPLWDNVSEVYNLKAAEKLQQRLHDAGGNFEINSLLEAYRAQQAFLQERDSWRHQEPEEVSA